MKELYFTKKNIIDQSHKIIKSTDKYANGRLFEFDRNQSILLVTDMQEFFLNPDSHAFVPSAPAIVPGIVKLITSCLNNNIPVITTKHMNSKLDAANMMVWWKRILSPENPLVNIINSISEFNLPVITKSQYDAFFQTELDSLIGKYQKTQIIICGVMTNLCCETTCRSAYVRGYQTFFPVNTTAAYNMTMHQSTFNNMAFGFAQAIMSTKLIKKIEK